MKIVIFDTETSGLPSKHFTYEKNYMEYPYILSMAWKIVVDGQESNTFHYLINQGDRKVPPEATKVNGITDEMCQGSKFDAFTVLLQFLMDCQGADFVVGYNIFFDSSIIKANVLRIVSGGKTPMNMYDAMTEMLHKDKRIDVMRLSHKVMGGKWPRLEESYKYFFGVPPLNSHNAAFDVEDTYRIFQELLKRKAIMLILPEKVVQEFVEKVITEEEF